MAEKLKVVVVDDDEGQLRLVASMLRSDGFDVATAEVPFGASNLVRQFRPDIVLLDMQLPGLSGDRLLEVIREVAEKSTQLVLYSAADKDILRSRAQRVGADGWIQKDFAEGALAQQLRTLWRQARTVRRT